MPAKKMDRSRDLNWFLLTFHAGNVPKAGIFYFFVAAMEHSPKMLPASAVLVTTPRHAQNGTKRVPSSPAATLHALWIVLQGTGKDECNTAIVETYVKQVGQGMKLLCFYGTEERDTLCRDLEASLATAIPLKGGHHFDGNYSAMAKTILNAAR